MLLFYRIGILVCIAALIVYLGCYWWKPRAVERKILMIRKSWYALYFTGAAIVLVNHPSAAITNWKAFAITAGIFALVDIFVFLSMYIKKVGNAELERQIQNLQESTSIVVDNKQKLNDYIRFLNEEGIDLYTDSSGTYLKGLTAVAEKWAEACQLSLKFFPFNDQKDKETVLSIIPQNRLKEKARLKLDERLPYFFGKNKQVLLSVHLKEKGEYVIHLTSHNLVTETDCLLLNALLLTYDLVYHVKDSSTAGEKQLIQYNKAVTASAGGFSYHAKPLIEIQEVPFSPKTKQLIEETEKALRDFSQKGIL